MDKQYDFVTSLIFSKNTIRNVSVAFLISSFCLSLPCPSFAETSKGLILENNDVAVRVYTQGDDDQLYMNIWDKNSKSFVANANKIPVNVSQVKINSNDDWIKLWGIPAVVAAVISGIVTYIANRNLETLRSRLADENNTKLETLKSNLTAENNTKLETLKSNLTAENNTKLETLKNKYAKELEEYRQNLEKQASTEERIKDEIIRWANPILEAVKNLEGRLNNILQYQGYIALNKEPNTKLNPNWSISYDYFMPSTLYYFAQYFCWVTLLLQELNWLIFKSQTEKDNFFKLINQVRFSLSDFPPPYPIPKGLTGKDLQVFSLQQRAIGELLIISNDQGKECMKYSKFLQEYDKEPLKSILCPLRQLLESVGPGEHRWQRLEATKESITKLKGYCEDLLKVPHSQSP